MATEPYGHIMQPWTWTWTERRPRRRRRRGRECGRRPGRGHTMRRRTFGEGAIEATSGIV